MWVIRVSGITLLWKSTRYPQDLKFMSRFLRKKENQIHRENICERGEKQ